MPKNIMEKSLWIENSEEMSYSQLEKNERTEVCIIGGRNCWCSNGIFIS